MERKLASIQRVLEVAPIAGADAIELVRINGWQCVTKKGEFAAGDLGVFLEIDAVPPDEARFRFLWTPRDVAPTDQVQRPTKFRIRTMKLRGALSQGLFLPLGSFALNEVAEGEDVTEVLAVTKFEPPAPESGSETRGPFPSFVPKTDEMRVQSVPAVLDELRSLPYVATLKYDGTSATFLVDPYSDEFQACGRNVSIVEGNSVYWRLARQLDLESKLRARPGLAIQGEIVGPSIQKNRLALKGLELFVFNVYDFRAGRYLEHDAARDLVAELGLQSVAEVERGESFLHTQDSLLVLAEGKYPGTQNEREGLVIRPLTSVFSETLAGRLSFKAISNRFLLKDGD